MKIWIVLFAVTTTVVHCKVVKRQASVPNCSQGNLAGSRCVDKSVCNKPLNNPPCSDFANLGNGYECRPENECVVPGFERRTLSIDERHDLAVNATCPRGNDVCCLKTDPRSPSSQFPDIDSRMLSVQDESCTLEGQICCPEENISTPVLKSFACHDKSDEGFSCNSVTDCSEDPEDTDSNGHCPSKRTDDPQPKSICCRPKPKSTVERCSDFEQNGYQCVHEDQCAPSGFIRRFDDRASKARCDSRNHVCCSSDDIVQPECSTYSDDGFDCTSKDQCLDTLFPSTTSSVQREGTCGRSSDVCCEHKNPGEDVNTANTCEDIRGYECLPVQSCNLDAPFMKSTSAPLMEFKDGVLELNSGNKKCPGDINICCKKRLGTNEPAPEPEPAVKHSCGKHNKRGFQTIPSSPIDGDRTTNFGEWPFACLMYEKKTQRHNVFIGGASLIAPGILVTAAHKTEVKINDQWQRLDAEDILVRCGDWDIDENSEVYEYQERQVEYISRHPAYNDLRLFNDLALLHVAEDFDLTKPHIETICLPNEPLNRDNSYSHEGCVVTGWGERAEDPDSGFQNTMKAVKGLPIVSNDECQRAIRQVVPRFSLHDSFVCAGGEAGIDACEGDGGGPLVCPSLEDSDRYVLAGAVAGGIGCGQEGIPGAYASIDENLCFIHWATKCKAGFQYKEFYWYPGQCDDWLERARTDDKYRNYKQQLEELASSCKQQLG